MRVLWCRAVDVPPPTQPANEPAAYTYAATDLAPRQAHEKELCTKASHFDWQYTGGFFLAFLTSVWIDIGPLKLSEEPGVRLIGPGLVGFTWGGTLSGGYLSLPKCDPMWTPSVPPEGDVRASWPIAVAITALAGAMGPVMDYTFLGAPKPDWTTPEKSARVFVAMGAGILGALFPYVLPPRTWAAKKEIEKLRLEGIPNGAIVGYGATF